MLKEPNFSCRVSEKVGASQSRSTRLVCAESEQAARDFLDKKGYFVHSANPYDFKTEWETDTKNARDQAEKSHDDPKFEFPNLWGDLKEHLQDLYHDKCAYCDGAYEAFSYGDVEHFRPKGKVTEDNTHPGYWWLAYNPSNYLPSCQKCNQAAKNNHFPIEGKRARGPGDSLEAEGPLLMHPDQDRWKGNVRFRPSTDPEKPGWADDLTKKGKVSIEILELNRKPLRDARVTVQQLARGDYGTAWFALIATRSNAQLQAVKQRYEAGVRAFYAAAMDEIDAYHAEIMELAKKDGGD